MFAPPAHWVCVYFFSKSDCMCLCSWKHISFKQVCFSVSRWRRRRQGGLNDDPTAMRQTAAAQTPANVSRRWGGSDTSESRCHCLIFSVLYGIFSCCIRRAGQQIFLGVCVCVVYFNKTVFTVVSLLLETVCYCRPHRYPGVEGHGIPVSGSLVILKVTSRISSCPYVSPRNYIYSLPNYNAWVIFI